MQHLKEELILGKKYKNLSLYPVRLLLRVLYFHDLAKYKIDSSVGYLHEWKSDFLALSYESLSTRANGQEHLKGGFKLWVVNPGQGTRELCIQPKMNLNSELLWWEMGLWKLELDWKHLIQAKKRRERPLSFVICSILEFKAFVQIEKAVKTYNVACLSSWFLKWLYSHPSTLLKVMIICPLL